MEETRMRAAGTGHGAFARHAPQHRFAMIGTGAGSTSGGERMDRSARRLAVLSDHLAAGPALDDDELLDVMDPEQDNVAEQLAGLCLQGVAADGVESRPEPSRRRAVIVDGCRTPFCKSFGELMQVDTIGLGVAAVGGLLQKTKLDPSHINEVIWGGVVLPNGTPNIAREIVLDLNLPRTIPGVTVSRACLSGLQAVLQAVVAIEHGDAECIVAGGSDSLSNAEMVMPRRVTHALARFQYGGKRRGLAGVIQLVRELGPPTGWLPRPASIAERSTGRTMGYHADLMAEINAISRQAQDEFALASHRKAAAAAKSGRLREEIVPVTVGKGRQVTEDNLIRGQQDMARVSQLPPVFRRTGTVTAASSSPLTDGASAVLVMSEEKALELGYPTDIVVRAFATTAIDPFPQLLLAPAVAIPRALDLAGLTIDQIDVFEVHEAFAAQVLATIACLASPEFARQRLGRDEPVGAIPSDRLNPNGSSIAIGHPFAATGGRLVTAAIHELRRSKKRFALVSICAAGGMGGVCILERREPAA